MVEVLERLSGQCELHSQSYTEILYGYNTPVLRACQLDAQSSQISSPSYQEGVFVSPGRLECPKP